MIIRLLCLASEVHARSNNNYERIGSVNQNSSHSNLISDDCYKQNGIVPSPIHRGSSLRHNWKGDKSSPRFTKCLYEDDCMKHIFVEGRKIV
jgi:hypothetical protein